MSEVNSRYIDIESVITDDEENRICGALADMSLRLEMEFDVPKDYTLIISLQMLIHMLSRFLNSEAEEKGVAIVIRDTDKDEGSVQ